MKAKIELLFNISIDVEIDNEIGSETILDLRLKEENLKNTVGSFFKEMSYKDTLNAKINSNMKYKIKQIDTSYNKSKIILCET